MKSSPKSHPSPEARQPLSAAGLIERIVLGGLLAAAVYFFIEHNGFIDSNGVWAYPY